MTNVKKVGIQKVSEGSCEEVEDLLVVEYPFTIFVNDSEFITLLCTPEGLDYLALGFLASEGVIKSIDQIDTIRIEEEKGQAYINTNVPLGLKEKLYGKRTITTGCGKGTVFYNVLDSLGTQRINSTTNITSESIFNLVNQFNKMSKLFKDTGGVHSCCLCNDKEIILFHEDVGRHNALDKIIGEAMIKDIRLDDKILISSGRISSEMIIKTSKRGIPIIISRSAPTNLSYNIAKDLGVTLVGFVRGKRMNIYNDENRVLISTN
ncbi:formate dehydrogenase accessory sulfurtransferase FdhD [Alkaliphilus peptidifermentans]|uniref:Sulfur carrier protein FdhD n=1 Tax=Alkaliphilus peptidifermentans DSM 18978 TaxID=1120976 RepID=A0A1G5KY99_9FIRM|nr:formate dehydrogenase accessory sulfurtransferase FdhD [Alkaliphilus peptidifermentans]SCZ05141.1 FdhD protein [Alkaliphilus peptidifermentans DSM 18978]